MKKVLWVLLAALFLALPASAATQPRVTLGISSLALGMTGGVNDAYTLKASMTGTENQGGITFRSTNPAVATVDPAGVVRSVSYGYATIYAEYPQAVTAKLPVKVGTIRAKKLLISRTGMTLQAGRAGMSLTATALPATADSQKVSWRSSRPSIAVVDQNGLVTPLKPGKTVVTCRTQDGSRLKRNCLVTVKAVSPQSVSVSPGTIEVSPGGKTTLSYEISPADATNRSVVWKSSNPKVATVSQTGVVTGVKLGSATITCVTRSGAKKCQTPVRVCFGESDVRVVAIGQQNYRTYTPLYGAIDDAQTWENAVSGMEIGQKTMDANVLSDLTADELRRTFSALCENTDENDVTYLYYSGHGADGDRAQRGALVGVDGGMVYVEEIKTYLDRVPGTVVVILDCCLSGQFVSAKGAVQATPTQLTAFKKAMVSGISSELTAKGSVSLTSTSTRKKYKLLVAARPRQLSWMIRQKSIFTQYLVEAIDQMSTADRNKNRYLSLNEAYQYVAPRVSRLAGSYGVTQQPMVWPASDPFPIYGTQAG